MKNLLRCFVAGLVTLIAVTIVCVTVVTTELGSTTAAYRRLEFSAQVSYFAKELLVSNTSNSNVSLEQNTRHRSDNGTFNAVRTFFDNALGHQRTIKSVPAAGKGGTLSEVRSTLQSTITSTLSHDRLENVVSGQNAFPDSSEAETKLVIESHHSSQVIQRDNGKGTSSPLQEVVLKMLSNPSQHHTVKMKRKVRRRHKQDITLPVKNLTHSLIVTPEPTDNPVAIQLKHLTLLLQSSNFSLPCSHVYKPVKTVTRSHWIMPLIEFLSRCESKEVTVVIANTAYKEILLNWLVSAEIIAKPPIENILIVTLDLELHDMLTKRGLDSIWVPFSSILNEKYRFKRYFEFIMMVRLGMMRIINYFGYNCAMYDIDAIVLRNPQKLYSRYKTDIVSSRGSLPKELMRKWHVTMCIGAVFIRSNPRTGKFNFVVKSIDNSIQKVMVGQN